MKFSYRLSKVCGNVFENGNLLFTSDGNSVISPIGNRITIFDLVKHSTITLPFENKKSIHRVALSHNGRFLISVDVDGHALLINFPRRVVLTRIHFKRKVMDVKFSPDDRFFAITFGHGCQIWRTPGIQREFSPLVLSRTVAGHHDDTTCLEWSSDSNSLVIGSRDLTARVYYRVHSKNMSMSMLVGHRSELMGAHYFKDDNQIFTVGADGAVFSWTFNYADRVPIQDTEVSDDETEEESDDEETNGKVSKTIAKKTARGGEWKLTDRTFLWDQHTEVISTAYSRDNSLLVIGFHNGVFGLYEMPGCINIHKLSVSHNSLNTVSINSTGEWLAIGSSALGQMLVWEWQSESYVIKQQGHMYGLNCMDFSGDGLHIATGGDDAKVKLWNVSSGFCFVTFSEHLAPVTGVKFVGKGTGKSVISASLDGTVRAHDLLRYQNFRTMTTPSPVQLSSLAVDSSGEMICAGSMDPFEIYVWSLQTGTLLDVLAGHEGPIACLAFAQDSGRLASGSWDGTLKLWDIYKNECTETFEHGCDCMAVAFRPDGLEVCTTATNGNIYVWDVVNGSQSCLIEGRRDISGGRKSSDIITADTASRSKYFNAVTYSADGACILAGGKSKYVCIYAVKTGALVKKFELSHNRSLDGMVSEIRSDMLVDGVAVPMEDSNEGEMGLSTELDLPGAGKGNIKNDGSRSTRPEMLTAAVGFSSTGHEWAAATTQGLQIFSLDEGLLFAPTDLDITITPQAVSSAIARQEFTLAINMALHLAEPKTLKLAVDAVDIMAIGLVVKTIDQRLLKRLMVFLADELSLSRHVEFYLRWCWAILSTHGKLLQGAEMKLHQEAFRALIRAISIHEKEILKVCDNNYFVLNFLESQIVSTNKRNKSENGCKALAESASPSTDTELLLEDDISGDQSGRKNLLELYTKTTSGSKHDKDSNEVDTGDVDAADDSGITMVIDRKKQKRKPLASSSPKRKKAKKQKMQK